MTAVAETELDLTLVPSTDLSREWGAVEHAGLHASEDVVGLGRIDLWERLEARHQAQRECFEIDAECELMAIHHIRLERQSDLSLQRPDEPLQRFIRRALQLLRGGAGLCTPGRKPEEQPRPFVAPRYPFDVFTCAELALNPVSQRHRIDGKDYPVPAPNTRRVQWDPSPRTQGGYRRRQRAKVLGIALHRSGDGGARFGPSREARHHLSGGEPGGLRMTSTHDSSREDEREGAHGSTSGVTAHDEAPMI